MDATGFPIIGRCSLSPKLTPLRSGPPRSKAANSRLRLNCAAVSKALPTTRRPVPACAALSGGRHDLRSRLTPRHPLPQPSVRRRNHRDYLHSPAYPAVAATAAWGSNGGRTSALSARSPQRARGGGLSKRSCCNTPAVQPTQLVLCGARPRSQAGRSLGIRTFSLQRALSTYDRYVPRGV